VRLRIFVRTGAGRTPVVGDRYEVLVTAISLVCIVGGVELTLWSVPSDVAAEGALTASGMWMCLGLACVVGADVIFRGLGAVFRAENAVMLGIAYFLLLDLVQGLYPVTASADVVGAAFIAVALFAGGCVVAKMVPPFRLPRAIRESMTAEYSEGRLLALLGAFFCLGMFRFFWASGFSVEVLIEGLGAPRFSAPWSRGDFGGWDALTDALINFGYPLATFTVMLALRGKRWVDWKVCVGVFLSAIFLLFIAQGGSRRLVGVAVGAALFTWVCGNRNRLRFASALGVVVTIAALLVVMDVQLEARNDGWAEYIYEAPGSGAIRVDDNFFRLTQVIDAVPGNHPHIGFQWIWYLIVRPIPRIFWAGKPVDAGFSLPDYLGLEGVSLSTSVIGEWYLGFGWAGVFVGGLLFGVLGRTWSQVLEDGVTVKSLGLYGFGVMVLFLGIRSMIELILLCYPLILWILADRLLRQRPGPGRGRTPSEIMRHHRSNPV
jgi:hypothetical protein